MGLFQEACRDTHYSFAGWTWSAVFVGTITALIFQLLLLMAAYGVGLLSIDVPTAGAAMGFGRGALLWLLGVPLPIVISWRCFGADGGNVNVRGTGKCRRSRLLPHQPKFGVRAIRVLGVTDRLGANAVVGFPGPRLTSMLHRR